MQIDKNQEKFIKWRQFIKADFTNEFLDLLIRIRQVK